jgi:NADH:ubiquinone oxidoreductase subunit F (NADH-binding)
VSAVLTEVACGAHPTLDPRLVVGNAPLDLEQERCLGTFTPGDPARFIAVLQAAGLRGRGGAGFPTGRKLDAVARTPGAHVIVANGGEGEPSSLKDRWLMRHRPHLVLDGLQRAAQAISAARAVVYVTDETSADSMSQALREQRQLWSDVTITLHQGPAGYVSGEETAVCRAINGGPALPTDKPPRPFERGVDGLATAVVNVETLAHASVIAREGAAAHRRHGTAASPGTTLVTLGGCCRAPGVYEVPFGLSLAEMFESVGGGFTTRPAAFLVGGWFGGVLDARGAELRCCHETMAAAGTGVGCAAFTAIGEDEDALEVVAGIGAWYARESSRQCGVCVKGTAAIAGALADLASGRGDDTTLERLQRWRTTLRDRGACALLDGAATLAGSVGEQLRPARRPPAMNAATDKSTEEERP